jgi:hypothetical protein
MTLHTLQPTYRALLSRLFGSGAVAVGVALAGCNGSSSASTTPCSPPNGIETTLVYPAPGSSGIPDNLSQVIFGSTAALPSNYQAYLVNNATQAAVTFNAVAAQPSPLPTPNALPTFSSPVYQASTNSGQQFGSGAAISVYLIPTGGGCVPVASLGTFTVQ